MKVCQLRNGHFSSKSRNGTGIASNPLIMKAIFPCRSLGVLLAIGFLDLVATAVLHERGFIVELNPLMRVFIERSEWLFALVKGTTLVAAWYVLKRYWATHADFINKACWVGSAAYLLVWSTWMASATFAQGPA